MNFFGLLLSGLLWIVWGALWFGAFLFFYLILYGIFRMLKGVFTIFQEEAEIRRERKKRLDS